MIFFFLGPGLQRGSCRQGSLAPQFYAQSLSHRAPRAPGRDAPWPHLSGTYNPSICLPFSRKEGSREREG